MGLRENVEQLLQGLSSDDAPRSVRTSDGDGVQIRIDLTAIDSMSCEFAELELFHPRMRTAQFDLLRQWAEALSQRVSYLLENIGPLEFDPHAGQVLIRSTPPQTVAGQKRFYEVILSSVGNGTFVLRRYESTTGRSGRTQVPLQLTIEVLLKLVDDLLATVPQKS